jgi:hypothetical protein
MRRKFHVGDSVNFHSRYARGVFTVTGLLPARDGEPHFQIQSSAEDHSRAAAESELSPA